MPEFISGLKQSFKASQANVHYLVLLLAILLVPASSVAEISASLKEKDSGYRIEVQNMEDSVNRFYEVQISGIKGFSIFRKDVLFISNASIDTLVIDLEEAKDVFMLGSGGGLPEILIQEKGILISSKKEQKGIKSQKNWEHVVTLASIFGLLLLIKSAGQNPFSFFGMNLNREFDQWEVNLFQFLLFLLLSSVISAHACASFLGEQMTFESKGLLFLPVFEGTGLLIGFFLFGLYIVLKLFGLIVLKLLTKIGSSLNYALKWFLFSHSVLFVFIGFISLGATFSESALSHRSTWFVLIGLLFATLLIGAMLKFSESVGFKNVYRFSYFCATELLPPLAGFMFLTS